MPTQPLLATLLTALLLPSALGAQAAQAAKDPYENFEAGIPVSWKATGGAELAQTTERFKSGEHSLCWSWKAAAEGLEVSGTNLFDNKRGGKGFGCWVYQEQPAAAPMRAELLSQGKVVASLWFWMDFQGWRPLGASYAELGLKPGQSIDTLRLHPPEGVARGRLFLDCARFDLSLNPGDARAKGGQMPWTGVAGGLDKKPEELALSDADIRKNRPWLPERKSPAQITAQERADMDKLAQRLLPPPSGPGKGLKPEALDALRQTMRTYRIRRDAKGRVTGRPVDSGSFLAPADAVNVWEYLKFCDSVEKAHAQSNDPAQRGELERMFVDLCAHLLDQGWCLDSRFRAFQNYPDAAPTAFLAMRETLDKAGLARGVALALASTLGGQGDGQYLMKDPVASMDCLGYWSSELYPILLMLPDESERLQHLLVAKRFHDLALVNPDTLGPDGCPYHHGGAHFTYAGYDIPRLVNRLIQAKDTCFRLGREAHERLRFYPHAVALAISGGQGPYNIGLRCGMPVNDFNIASNALAIARLGSPDGGQPIDPDMLAISAAIYKGGLALPAWAGDPLKKEPFKSWLAQGGRPAVLTGNLSLNGATFAIHRRPGFLVSISGNTALRRCLEIYGWTQHNNYGRFLRNGSICLVSGGDPPTCAGSGWAYDGWDWRHIPGTTAVLQSNTDMFDGYAMPGNGSAFAGGTDLDEDGIFAMDQVGGPVSFKKTVFCFDDRLTVVTSDIKPDGKSGTPAITTLFQNSLRPGHDAITLDDGSALHLGESKQSGENAPIRWLIDNQSVGYLLPPGQPALRLACRRQEWTYWIQKYLVDSKKNPFPDIPSYRYWNGVRAKADLKAINAHYKPSVGEFALGWFDHGAQPAADAGCAYTMVIGATPERMKHFAANPSYEILSHDSHVHALHDKPTGTTAYALFSANAAIAAAGPLRANNMPCHVMLRPDGAKLKLSVACTDTRRTSPVTLTLDGIWKPATPMPQILRSVSDGTTTTLDLQPDSHLPLHLELAPAK